MKIRWSPKKAFSGRNHKFKPFFRPKTGDLQKKRKGLRRNPKAFSGRFHKLKRFFRPKTETLSSQKNTVGGQEINRGGKNENREGNALLPPAGDAPGRTHGLPWLRPCLRATQSSFAGHGLVSPNLDQVNYKTYRKNVTF